MIVAIISVIAAIIFFFAITMVSWMIGTYNLFVNSLQNIKTQWSNVLTEYQRRADILYNMTQSVKSYAKFENKTMVEVIKARSGNFGSGMPEQMKNVKKMEDSFSNVLSRLMVVVEKYPKLRAVEEYERLSHELKNTEDRINVARTSFNGTVREYNGAILIFPNKILANWWGYKEHDYYVTNEDSKIIEKEGRIDMNVNY